MEKRDVMRLREDARRIFSAGLSAVDPERAVLRHCRLSGEHLAVGGREFDLSRFSNIYVVGAGKASAPMAAALEQLLGERVTGGLINVKHGHAAALSKIRQVEAGHPIPDEAGCGGAREIMDIAGSAGKNDLVFCVFSGGGSALLPLPDSGITLADKQQTTQALIDCGAVIHEINALRKHLSGIKGGKLARAAHPGALVSLILSDVVGDDLDVIASGPAVPDASSFVDCLRIVDKYGIRDRLPDSVIETLVAGRNGKIAETPKAGDDVFFNTFNQIVGSNIEAVLAAEAEARRLGYHTLALSSLIEGDTREAAHFHCAILREIRKTGRPLSPPACILSGGETTVKVVGNGKGGRAQEFALASACEIDGVSDVAVLCAGTDGTDGPTDAAGAFADSTTIPRAADADLDPDAALANNDAYPFFQTLDDLLVTGPTKTNVMDLRILLAG